MKTGSAAPSVNPSVGWDFEAIDPLEWVAHLADHMPDPGRHRTHCYARYANRVRVERRTKRRCVTRRSGADDEPQTGTINRAVGLAP